MEASELIGGRPHTAAVWAALRARWQTVPEIAVKAALPFVDVCEELILLRDASKAEFSSGSFGGGVLVPVWRRR